MSSKIPIIENEVLYKDKLLEISKSIKQFKKAKEECMEKYKEKLYASKQALKKCEEELVKNVKERTELLKITTEEENEKSRIRQVVENTRLEAENKKLEGKKNILEQTNIQLKEECIKNLEKLQEEKNQLKEEYSKNLEKLKEIKAENIIIREEKERLETEKAILKEKAEKERLETEKKNKEYESKSIKLIQDLKKIFNEKEEKLQTKLKEIEKTQTNLQANYKDKLKVKEEDEVK